MNLPVDVGLGDIGPSQPASAAPRRSRPVPLQPTNRLRQDRRPRRGPHEFCLRLSRHTAARDFKRLSNQAPGNGRQWLFGLIDFTGLIMGISSDKQFRG
jgi:hypothetical protein